MPVNVPVSVSGRYQNEDEPHALSSHVINQGGQVFELRVQDKVELAIHVVNVCILHILQMPEEQHLTFI